jgi:hypothetical protein
MSKKSAPSVKSGSETSVRHLEKRILALEKQIKALTNPKRTAAGPVVGNSLQIINPKGKVVASIAADGFLTCAGVRAQNDPSSPQIFIGGSFGEVRCSNIFVASGPRAKAVVAINTTGNAGYLKLTNNRNKTMTVLQGSGSNLFAYDKSGMLIANLTPGLFGGSLELYGNINGSKAKASIGIGTLKSDGIVRVTDSTGKKVASLEPKPQKRS